VRADHRRARQGAVGDALGELQRGIENVEYASYAPELLKGEHSATSARPSTRWSEFQPLGVTAGITPFNFPAMVPLWMWPMAVACGNTFILKPSERDPSSALHCPAGARSRPAARRAQRRQRRQGGGGHAADRPASRP
jgi:acyl-CoA reductase-like NAD-dependent aldehyde dehydrogenase